MTKLRKFLPVFLTMMIVAMLAPISAFAASGATDGVTQNVEIISSNLTNPDLAPNMWFAFKFLSGPMQLIQVVVGVASVAIIFFLLLRVTLDLLVITIPGAGFNPQGGAARAYRGMKNWSSINEGGSTNYKDYLRKEFISNVVLGLIIVSIISSGLAMTLSAKSIDFMAYALRQVVAIDVNGLMEKSGDQFRSLVESARGKYGEVTKDNTFIRNTAEYYAQYGINVNGNTMKWKTNAAYEKATLINNQFNKQLEVALKEKLGSGFSMNMGIDPDARDASGASGLTGSTSKK